MDTDTSRIAHGGKGLYGSRVGILMLETQFPRIPGDMGNGLTWPFPVLYKVVPGATPDRVVRHKSAGLINAFLDAAAELVQLGADGITTTCGFLSLYQREIAAHVRVPVATSSLMQIPLVERILPPGKRVGVLDGQRREPDPGALHRRRRRSGDAGRRHRATAANSPASCSTRSTRLDAAAAERDILDAGDALVSQHPDIGAVVLECTNMVPYARALSDHLLLPVYSIYTFVTWFHAGLAPRDFGPPGSGAARMARAVSAPDITVRFATADDVPLAVAAHPRAGGVRDARPTRSSRPRPISLHHGFGAEPASSRRSSPFSTASRPGCALFHTRFSTWLGRPGLYLEDLYVARGGARPRRRQAADGAARRDRHRARLGPHRFSCARLEPGARVLPAARHRIIMANGCATAATKPRSCACARRIEADR